MSKYPIFVLAWLVLSLGLLAETASASETLRRGEFEHDVSLKDLLGEDFSAEISNVFDGKDKITWSLYVPKDYSPANPPGIFVFVSPISDGTIRTKWKRAFDAHNMIYISANGAGNYVPSKRRFYHSVLALSTVQKLYETDDRVRIISGFSGGGRMSTRILELLPGTFSGGLIIGGAYDWIGTDQALAQTLEGGAYVFLTGDMDHAEWETRRAYLQYKNAGVADLKYMSVRGLTHRFPGWKEMDKALAFLGERLRD